MSLVLGLPPPPPRLPCPSLVLSRSCVSLAVRLERLTASVSTCPFQIHHAVFQTAHSIGFNLSVSNTACCFNRFPNTACCIPNVVNRIRQPMPERPPFERRKGWRSQGAVTLGWIHRPFPPLVPSVSAVAYRVAASTLSLGSNQPHGRNWSCISGITPYR